MSVALSPSFRLMNAHNSSFDQEEGQTCRSENSNLLQYGSGARDGKNYPHSSISHSRQYRHYVVCVAYVAILSVFVAHISIRSYYSTLPISLKSSKKHKLTNDEYSRAQSLATTEFKKNLLNPTMKSELFYNGNGNEIPLRGGYNSKDEEVSPIRPPPEGCEVTIIIIRHCEGGPAREHCGYMGYQRSEYFATLFGEGGKYPEPSYIFALNAGERHNPIVRNWREIETVQPLADKINATIDTEYVFPKKRELVDHIYSLLQSTTTCGKIAVVSWKHHDIPKFSHSLGCGPEQGCPITFGEEDYDSIWQIKYKYHKELHAPYVSENHSKKAMGKHHAWGEHPQWFVYGAVQKMNFDPLVFSTSRGEYD
mmetsp:Transcript_24034/g.36647  ORF Transcript_24034/g.36647 Transcript_24034/m.36647 type:complete len:367 (-) Transcript_24034:76-1176(-)